MTEHVGSAAYEPLAASSLFRWRPVCLCGWKHGTRFLNRASAVLVAQNHETVQTAKVVDWAGGYRLVQDESGAYAVVASDVESRVQVSERTNDEWEARAQFVLLVSDAEAEERQRWRVKE